MVPSCRLATIRWHRGAKKTGGGGENRHGGKKTQRSGGAHPRRRRPTADSMQVAPSPNGGLHPSPEAQALSITPAELGESRSLTDRSQSAVQFRRYRPASHKTNATRCVIDHNRVSSLSVCSPSQP